MNDTLLDILQWYGAIVGVYCHLIRKKPVHA